MINDLIKTALLEDIGTGDVTTISIVREGERGTARVVAKDNFILCGLEIFREVFSALDNSISVNASKKDGDQINKGDIFMELTGSMKTLLSGERTALNFIQRLSGVATLTRKYVEAVKGTDATVLDTRKTTPGWRGLEKYAVLKGGARNHRKGLFDGILIKDNHIAAAGGVIQAVNLVKESAGPYLKIEVETQSMEQVREALSVGVDIIMLDNMPLDKMTKAVDLIEKRAITEASGNITLENICDVAKTGVDYISVGALTHSAVSVDISMKIVQ